MLLLGKELTSRAPFDDVVGVGEHRGLVEAGPEGFSR
jgi:hypothetical protein